MGKSRSSRVTERSDDTDYVDANKVGSHDPLGMTETSDKIITINYHFTKREILAAKHAQWEA